MTKLTILTLVFLSGLAGVTVVAQPGNVFPPETRPEKPLTAGAVTASTLEAAVQRFNAKTRIHPIGKNQLPLTEDEVVAAIRGWVPETTPGVTDKTYEKFQAIAESGELPPNTELSFLTKWVGYRGYEFKVWWIDLEINTGDNVRYRFRIRDQKISCRKMSTDELSELKQLTRELENSANQ